MIRRLILALSTLLLTSLPALAQGVETAQPKILEKESYAMEWLMAGIFLVGCMVIAFKPAKRSNLK